MDILTKKLVLFRETLIMLKGRKRNILYANKWSHDGGGVLLSHRAAACLLAGCSQRHCRKHTDIHTIPYMHKSTHERGSKECVCMYLLPNAYYSWCECMFEQSKQQQQQQQQQPEKNTTNIIQTMGCRVLQNNQKQNPLEKRIKQHTTRRKNMGNNFISSPKCALMPNLLLLNFYNNNTFPKGGLLPPSLWAVLSSVISKIMPFSQHQSGRQNIAISFLPLSPLCVLYS